MGIQKNCLNVSLTKAFQNICIYKTDRQEINAILPLTCLVYLYLVFYWD